MVDSFILFQVVVGILITLFIVFPIAIPLSIVWLVNRIYGIILAIIIVFILFIYMNPILGILFIIAVYVLYIRSNKKVARFKQTQENTNHELVEMSKPPANHSDTLEEFMVNMMAPSTADKPLVYLHSQFKPINEPIGSASVI